MNADPTLLLSFKLNWKLLYSLKDMNAIPLTKTLQNMLFLLNDNNIHAKIGSL